MKSHIFLSAFTIALLIGASGSATHSQTSMPTHDLMRKKLDHAQSILEGIALKDFNMIQGNAARLEALSSESAWRLIETPEYGEQSQLFRRNVQKLRKAARDENLEAVTLAYMKVTFSCVECHNYLRDRKVASGPKPTQPFDSTQ